MANREIEGRKAWLGIAYVTRVRRRRKVGEGKAQKSWVN
jgi:hypothetical protein